MSKIIRINLTDCSVKTEVNVEKYALLGGRGLTSRIVFDEVDATCNALGEDNKLVIAPGLFAGTNAPCSSRLSIGAKSPLTGGIKESNAGGTLARKLARLGIKAIILEGQPLEKNSWYVLKISSEEIGFDSADKYLGMGNYETMALLQENYGNKVGMMSIGQAGEKQMSIASVAVADPQGNPSRHCGRGGLGAVLGSKRIKAIIVDDSKAKEYLMDISDPEGFNEIAREWAKNLIATKSFLTNFGTAGLVAPIGATGGLPTRNFSQGTFEGADKINGNALAETIKSRNGKTEHACSPGCVIRCSNVYNKDGGDYLTSGLEYETITLMGANLGIDSLDTIAGLDRRCDDYGLDTMDMGVAIGIAMEAGLAEFGDSEAAIRLLDEVPKGTVLGRLLGQGAAITGKVLGVEHIPAIKGQSMAAYDPRAVKGTGVTYATSTMGADHTAGNVLPGRGALSPASPEGQIEASRSVQISTAVIDNMGLCIFVGTGLPEIEIVTKLLSKGMNKDFAVDEVLELGKNILRNELAFNRMAGFTKANDRMPESFRKRKLSPKDLVFDVMDHDLDMVHNY